MRRGPHPENLGSLLGCACEEIAQSQGKKELRGLRGAVDSTLTEVGMLPIPTGQPGNPHNSQHIVGSIQRDLASIVANN